MQALYENVHLKLQDDAPLLASEPAAMQAEEARIVLHAEAGRQLDEHVVACFLERLDQGAIHLQQVHGEHASSGTPIEFSFGFLNRSQAEAN